jgi:hypothetical protein
MTTFIALKLVTMWSPGHAFERSQKTFFCPTPTLWSVQLGMDPSSGSSRVRGRRIGGPFSMIFSFSSSSASGAQNSTRPCGRIAGSLWRKWARPVTGFPTQSSTAAIGAFESSG